MTIKFGQPSTLSTPMGDFIIDDSPNGSGMHVLIQIAVRWTAETASDEGRQRLLDVLKHGVARFGKGTATENDENMLPIYRRLARHSRSLVSRGLLYARLYEEKCYQSSAAFYRDWIEAVIRDGNDGDVETIVALAKSHQAEPMMIVEKAVGKKPKDAFDLRDKVMDVLCDVNRGLEFVIRVPGAAAEENDFAINELNYILSTTRMSEILNYLGSAIAKGEHLHYISERIGAIRVIGAEVGAEEAK